MTAVSPVWQPISYHIDIALNLLRLIGYHYQALFRALNMVIQEAIHQKYTFLMGEKIQQRHYNCQALFV